MAVERLRRRNQGEGSNSWPMCLVRTNVVLSFALRIPSSDWTLSLACKRSTLVAEIGRGAHREVCISRLKKETVMSQPDETLRYAMPAKVVEHRLAGGSPMDPIWLPSPLTEAS